MNKSRSLLYPKGTYQTPSFFFRGGDEFKENERLQSEYIAAKNDLKRAKKELSDAKIEYNKVKNIFDDKEGRAVALAESLGGENVITTENAQYRKQIAELAVEINDLRRQLNEIQSHSSIATINSIEYERSSYFLTIENLQVQLNDMENNTKTCQNRLFKLYSSPEWRKRSITYSNYEIEYRYNEFLKKNSKSSFEQQNFGDSEDRTPMKKNFDTFLAAESIKHPELVQKLQSLMSQRTALDMKYQSVVRERYLSQIKRKVQIAAFLDDIEKLDWALIELGEEAIGIDDLRRSYLPDGPFSQIGSPSISSRRSPKRPLTSPATPSLRSTSPSGMHSLNSSLRNSPVGSSKNSSYGDSNRASASYGIRTVSRNDASRQKKNTSGFIQKPTSKRY